MKLASSQTLGRARCAASEKIADSGTHLKALNLCSQKLSGLPEMRGPSEGRGPRIRAAVAAGAPSWGGPGKLLPL
eukprot:8634643-Pyramimonas_sp.AAC.1